MRKFEIINKNKIPKKISFIKWDVDGTVTDKDVLNPKIMDWIIKLSLNDIVSFFITGRDVFWLKDFFIKPLKRKIGKNSFLTSKIAENVFLRAELGLVEINNPISERKKLSSAVKGHPFLSKQKREKLANLFFEPKNLLSFKKSNKIPEGFEVGNDSQRTLFLFPKKPPKNVIFPDFIWSNYKIAMGTPELRREIDGSISSKRAKKIIPQAKKLEEILKKWGYLDFVSVSPVTTCINLPLKINGIPADKDWAVGKSLIYLSKKFKTSVEEIAEKTVSIGDGIADFMFSTPLVERKNISIPFIFVGPQNQYKPTAKQKSNVMLKSVSPFIGTEVTLEILKYLNKNFAPFRNQPNQL